MSNTDDDSDNEPGPPWGEAPHPADTVVHVDARSAPTPPHSLEAEREVLAAVLVDASAVDHVAAIPPLAWYFERHQVIAAAMLALRDQGSPIDPVVLQQALKDRGQYERIGGARAIGELLDRAGTCANVEAYVRIIVDKARLRRVIDAARALEVAAHQDVDDVDAFVANADETMRQALSGAAPRVEIDVRSLAESGSAEWFVDAPPPAKPVLTWGDEGRQPLLMAQGRVALLAAAGGVGKTYTLVQLAMAIATGEKWLDSYQVPHKGRVLLALAEEDLDEMRRRLWVAARNLGRFDDDDVQYLISEAVRNIVPLALMGRDVAFLDVERKATLWHRQLTERLGEQEWRAIIFDPLSRWGGPEIETDAHAATRAIQVLEEVTKLPGAPAVIVAHHTNKGALRDGDERTAGVVRGQSALVDGARWVGFLEKVRSVTKLRGRSRLTVVKSNYGPVPPALELVRNTIGALRPCTGPELEEEREEREKTKGKKGPKP